VTIFNKEKGIAVVFRKGMVLRKIIKVKFGYTGIIFPNPKGSRLVSYECFKNKTA